MLKYQKINLTQSNHLSFEGEIDAGTECIFDFVLLEVHHGRAEFGCTHNEDLLCCRGQFICKFTYDALCLWVLSTFEAFVNFFSKSV